MRLAHALFALAACGDNETHHGKDYLSYTWDDRKILCSDAVDDLANPVNWNLIDSQLAQAEKEKWALVLHAHTPGVTVSRDALTRLFGEADAHHLQYVTFDELVPGTPRAALAFAFDDNAPDAWMTVRDLLDSHHAHITFFLSRWDKLTDAQHAELATFAHDGHAIEPHTVHHLHALDYLAQNSVDAYMTDEFQPSLDVLTAAGYHPTSFAYPFGEHDDALDEALLGKMARVRTTPGECPW